MMGVVWVLFDSFDPCFRIASFLESFGYEWAGLSFCFLLSGKPFALISFWERQCVQAFY
jgi:hypothetical protein